LRVVLVQRVLLGEDREDLARGVEWSFEEEVGPVGVAQVDLVRAVVGQPQRLAAPVAVLEIAELPQEGVLRVGERLVQRAPGTGIDAREVLDGVAGAPVLLPHQRDPVEREQMQQLLRVLDLLAGDRSIRGGGGTGG
jgi:hypothetical protein